MYFACKSTFIILSEFSRKKKFKTVIGKCHTAQKCSLNNSYQLNFIQRIQFLLMYKISFKQFDILLSINHIGQARRSHRRSWCIVIPTYLYFNHIMIMVLLLPSVLLVPLLPPPPLVCRHSSTTTTMRGGLLTGKANQQLPDPLPM